jgi:hypothetical protein
MLCGRDYSRQLGTAHSSHLSRRAASRDAATANPREPAPVARARRARPCAVRPQGRRAPWAARPLCVSSTPSGGPCRPRYGCSSARRRRTAEARYLATANQSRSNYVVGHPGAPRAVRRGCHRATRSVRSGRRGRVGSAPAGQRGDHQFEFDASRGERSGRTGPGALIGSLVIGPCRTRSPCRAEGYRSSAANSSSSCG